MRINIFFLLVYSSHHAFGLNSCIDLLGDRKIFKIKDYESIQQPEYSVHSLSDHEREAVQFYTYEGDLLNSFTRYGYHNELEYDEQTFENYIRVLKTTFQNEFPSYRGVVFRSVTIGRLHNTEELKFFRTEANWRSFLKNIRELKVGSIVSSETFWSTSKKYVIARFTQGAISDKRVIFVIRLSNGVDLSNMAGKENIESLKPPYIDKTIPSHEVVILPGSKFKVTEVLNSKDPAITKVVVLSEL